jgi:DNA-binding NarL/FixJ family response regulator
MEIGLMKTIIAEKIGKVRSALQLLIEQELGDQIVGEVTCASSLYENLSFSKPDLLVLDWSLPGLEGSDRISKVRDLYPDLKVVAICSHGFEREIVGADSIITKGDPPERVLEVLRSTRLAGEENFDNRLNQERSAGGLR